MLKWCGSGGVVKSDYSVSSLSEKESRAREKERERESLTTFYFKLYFTQKI